MAHELWRVIWRTTRRAFHDTGWHTEQPPQTTVCVIPPDCAYAESMLLCVRATHDAAEDLYTRFVHSEVGVQDIGVAGGLGDRQQLAGPVEGDGAAQDDVGQEQVVVTGVDGGRGGRWA